jgi:arylsulfatase A-like enzyme
MNHTRRTFLGSLAAGLAPAGAPPYAVPSDGQLRTLALWDKTMIVLLGDHGYMMGEHGTWAKKHSNFEIATRPPLIVSVPGMAASVQTKALVEFVDVYPTLAELAGLRAPATLEGRSFVPLLNGAKTPSKPAAYSLHPGGGRMGRSVTGGHFPNTEWARTGRAPGGIELYDQAVDPGENRNRAGDPALGGDEVRLQPLLRSGFKNLKPTEAKS